MGLNDGSAACTGSGRRYVGIIIPTLKDYPKDYINEEQVAGSQ